MILENSTRRRTPKNKSLAHDLSENSVNGFLVFSPENSDVRRLMKILKKI
jgi:hypothetical protein